MQIDYLQWMGYVASVIIMVSMMMNSIIKFRWINCIGALLFSTYGFLINAYPVGVLNGIILLVDIYYLVQIYSKKETFELLLQIAALFFFYQLKCTIYCIYSLLFWS